MDENVRVYDFKKPQRYSSDNMRFLSVVSEEFCKNVNLFLAYELKKQKIQKMRLQIYYHLKNVKHMLKKNKPKPYENNSYGF